jgi:aspartyl-tRNA(Asn)/glutamyl-tRNA(Gln) amidotransferase subunit A
MPPPAEIGPLPLEARPGPRPLEGLTLAITDRPGRQALEEDVAAGLETARAEAEKLGAGVVDHPAPAELPGEQMSAVLLAEMWAYHRRFADRADRYRPSIGELVEAAKGLEDPVAYIRAQRDRDAFTAEWESWFSEHAVDFVLEPTVPLVAPVRGDGYDIGHAGGEGDPMISLTSTWDLTGFPVASLPAGVGSSSGLPVGVSLVGLRGAEAALLQAAIDLQEHALKPPRPPS